MFCSVCGAELPGSANFCNKCGSRIDISLPGATDATPAAPLPYQQQPREPYSQNRLPQQQPGMGAAPETGYYPQQGGAPPVLAARETIDIMECVREGWNLVVSDIGVFILGALIVVLINAAVGWIPFGSVFILPLSAGLMILAFKKLYGEKPGVADVFNGFRRYWNLLLVQLLGSMLIAVGMIFLIIPGIFLAVGMIMAMPLVVDRNMSFWEAISESMNAVIKQWWTFFALGLILILINILGFLALGIGLFVSIPVSVAAIAVAYTKMFEPLRQLP